MSLVANKLPYGMSLFVATQVPGDPVLSFATAFTNFFKNATLDGVAIQPDTESLPHAVEALVSGLTLAFKSTEKMLTCMMMQGAFVAYWAAKDPITLEVALKTMWPSCTPPAVVEQPLFSFLVPALDKEGMEPMEAHMAIAGAICDWLTTAVKVTVGGDSFYFV